MHNSIGFINYFDGKKYTSDLIKEIGNAGFNNILIWWGEYENLIPEEKQTIIFDAQKENLHIDSIHAPYSVANTLWSSDTTSNTQCEAFSIYKNCIQEAGKYNIPYVVIHPTRAHHLPSYIDYDAACYRIQELLDIAEQQNVSLAFENLVDTSYLDIIFSQFSHPRLRMCYDFGHSFCFSKEIDLIHKYAPYIVTTHIHDNNGFSDQHLLPGDGRLPWQLILKSLSEIGYTGSFNLECYKKNYDSNYQNKKFINDAYRKFCSLL